jgi:glycosyltransferase involved in cell wall biosynthesis
MNERTKTIDLELTQQVSNLSGLAGYARVKCLLRLRGVPVGWLDLPVWGDTIREWGIYGNQFEKNWRWIFHEILLKKLLAQDFSLSQFSALLDIEPEINESGNWPLLTVAVCTRDRNRELENCLEAIAGLNYPDREVIIVDNAPSDDETQRLVTENYPLYRYCREDRPGLDWARNRAIEEAKGEIIAFTDDDTLVDPGWATAIARAFKDEPTVMAVTGLVIPVELETNAQRLFELYGGFGRGFQRRWIRVDATDPQRWRSYGTGQYGTGANMAFRKAFFDRHGGFDPALDVGTVTNGGGDLEMFYRVIGEGYTLVYEPRAIVRHCHRRDYAQLRYQITNNGIGLISYFVRACIDHPQDRRAFFRLWLWWLHRWHLARLLRSFIQPLDIPRDLIWAEFGGFFRGLGRYFKARKESAKLPGNHLAVVAGTKRHLSAKRELRSIDSCAVRLIDLAMTLSRLDDITDYRETRLYVVKGSEYLGHFSFKNHYQAVGPVELADRIVQHFGLRLLDPSRRLSRDLLRGRVVEQLSERLGIFKIQAAKEEEYLSEDLSVSIVIATLDRPEALRRCLSSLMDIESERPLEIIVVDNNPSSGITPPVVADYPRVKYLCESRRGLSYARNCGIVAAGGQIIVTIDDDVTVPSGWLESLIRPFARPNVAAVTGNVLPQRLETHAQVLFETYGGLGRGPRRREADIKWLNSFRLDAVPTWRLGATANAAFRAEIFSENRIGLLDEMLGPGSPTGVGEDTELFYRILRARRSIVYEPDAFLWHDHRETMSGFRRQMYAYSKGHVSYHLVVLFRYGDFRSLRRILFQLPLYWFKQIYRWLRAIVRLRRPNWPLSLLFIEILGHLMGPWSLIRSIFRVRRLGRTDLRRRPNDFSTDRRETGDKNYVISD